MKKILILTAFALSVTSAAYASVTIDLATTIADPGKAIFGLKSGTPDNTSPLIGKCSSGVGIGMKTDPTGYALITQHKSGTKAFGSAFDSTSLYVHDETTGAADATTIGTGSTTFANAAWTTL